MDSTKANDYLDEMEKLLFNELERKEHTIDYFIERHKNTAKQSNEVIQIQGELDYYQKIHNNLINETSKLLYFLEDGKSNIGDRDQHDHRPSGEGGSGYLATISRGEESEKYDVKAGNIVNRADQLRKMCEQAMNKLEIKLEQLGSNP